MNLRRILLYIFLGIANLLVAQSNEVDEKSLSWKEIRASESIGSFKKFQKYFLNVYSWESSEERIAYYLKGYEAALELELDTATHKYSIELGFLYAQVDSFELALTYLNANLEHTYDYESRSNSYNIYSYLHSSIGDYSTALDYLFKSVEQAKLGGKGTEAYALGNITDIYVALGDYDNALKYTQAAIIFSKKF